MVNNGSRRLSKEDWILGALAMLASVGVDGVKIVPLAERLGVTSGSFYWHFKNRRELYNALLDYWEREMTDTAIEAAKLIESPKERIWRLMEQVMIHGLAQFDLAIWHWAQSDDGARKVFQRALAKRFAFAKWMFRQAGFSNQRTLQSSMNKHLLKNFPSREGWFSGSIGFERGGWPRDLL